MKTPSFRLSLSFTIALACAYVLALPAACWAQQTDGAPHQSYGPRDESGCPPLTILWPTAGATVLSCQHGDSVEVTLPLKPDAQGYAQQKRVRGAYEFREYKVQQSMQDSVFDNMLSELPRAGFKIKYSSKPSTITARKEEMWVLVNISDGFYNVSLVKEPPEVWASAKTAADISREMEVHNRVDIYGIQFSPDDQSVLEKESQILFEILKYLKQNPDLYMVIESHKWSTEGPSEKDGEITRERANAVMDWLIAHGVPRSHVRPLPAGRNHPITENATPSEIQRNERIILAKAAI